MLFRYQVAKTMLNGKDRGMHETCQRASHAWNRLQPKKPEGWNYRDIPPGSKGHWHVNNGVHLKIPAAPEYQNLLLLNDNARNHASLTHARLHGAKQL